MATVESNAEPSRVPALSPSEATARLLHRYRLPDGQHMDLFAAVAHHPAALDDLMKATTISLRDLALPVRDREIVILRTLARAGAEAEWALHVELFADAAELSEVELRATCAAGRDGWSAKDQDLIELADCCHDAAGVVPDDSWQRWQERWTFTELVALLTVAGQYRKVAILTNALALPVPAGLARFLEPRTQSAGTKGTATDSGASSPAAPTMMSTSQR